MYLMEQIFIEAVVFKYDIETDNVIYYPNLRQTSPAMIDSKHAEKLDSDRLCRLTTWTPQSDLKLDWVTPSEMETEPLNRIDFLFDA